MRRKMFLLSVILFFTAACLYGGDLFKFVHEGKANVCIVMPENHIPSEKYAAEELAGYLEKVTGSKFSFSGNGRNGVVRLVYEPSFGKEEWEYAVKDGEFVIRGGRPRGVLYGVYEFLEREAGVRWLTEDAEYVPRNPSFAVLNGLKRRGKPAFACRWIYDMPHVGCEKHYSFRTRARLNVYEEPKDGGARYGYIERMGSPGGCHTCYDYSKDFPDEYFSLSPAGKRQRAVGGAGPGGVCWSNTEVQRLFTEKLRRYIDNDRKSAVKTGRSIPMYYDISCNDTSDTCHCPECRKIAAKHGESGLFLHFLNSIARGVAKDYPDVTIISLAYGCALRPPKGIKAEKNVIMRIGQLGKELSSSNSRDSLRPLSHENNRQSLADIVEWSKYARMGTWDYWVQYTEPFRSPHISVSMLKENLSKYKELGFDFIFAEAENYSSYTQLRLQSFFELRDYVAYHLMLDTAADDRALIDEFISLFYGPAAEYMGKYYDYLAKRQSEEPGWLGIIHPERRSFLDVEFFNRVIGWLDQAEKAAGGDAVLRQRVRQERMIVDEAILYMHSHLSSKGFKPKSVDELVADLESDYRDIYNKYLVIEEERIKGLNDKIAEINAVKLRPPLPKELQGRRVFDYYWSVLTKDGDASQVVPDADSCTGAALIPKNHRDTKGFHSRPVAFGFYDRIEGKHQMHVDIPFDRLPRDEKYHWVRIGRIKPTAGTLMWVHWTWHCTVPVGNVFSMTEPHKTYDVFVSFKVQGPSYVKGSTKPDNMLVDRVVLAEYFDEKNTPTTDFGDISLLGIGVRPPLPPLFNGRKVRLDHIYTGAFDSGANNRVSPDSEAICGFASDPKPGSRADFHAQAPRFGVYDSGAKKDLLAVSQKDYPRDEKYHWFRVGTTKLASGAVLWMHWTWVNSLPLGKVFDPAAPDRMYEIWVSYKVQGPDYVPGSTKRNALLIDRIVVCDAEVGDVEK